MLSTLPGLLINVVFAGIMIGKRLPSARRIWNDFGAIAVAIFLAFLLLSGLRAIAQAAGSDLLDRFPLFPFTIIGGFTVQLVLSWTKHEHLVERRTVNDITGLSLDILIAAAIGTLSLSTLGANIPSMLILTALSVPIILSIGSLDFGIASAAATAALITWGLVRRPARVAARGSG